MNKVLLPAILAAAGFFLGSSQQASAFPRTKETASLDIVFNLAAPAPADPNAPIVSGTATVHPVTRLNGVETDGPMTFTLSNVAAGTYDVSAILKSDADVPPTPVLLGTIAVAVGNPTPTFTPAVDADVDALDIAILNVATQADPNVPDSTGTVILTGTPTEENVYWRFFGNRPVTPVAPTDPEPVHGKKPKRIHGHVLIQARIVNSVETRRKFLLVAHNGPANTPLTIKIDGVEAGTFTTTKNGKMMVKVLPVLQPPQTPVRLAGVHIVTICLAEAAADGTPAGTPIAEADFLSTAPNAK